MGVKSYTERKSLRVLDSMQKRIQAQARVELKGKVFKEGITFSRQNMVSFQRDCERAREGWRGIRDRPESESEGGRQDERGRET